MDVPTVPSHRKRVHFSYAEPVDSDDDDVSRVKKPRFPKGKKQSEVEGAGRRLNVIDGEEDDGSILSTDPRVAAQERATRRVVLTVLNSEELAVPNDVTAVEEDFEGDEERAEDGVAIEPFNLKQERREGYFDPAGNYVEYRFVKDGKDAWLDSLEGDTQFLGKHQAQITEDVETERDLSKEEIGSIKRRIADALQPGETVLQALRRFKGTSKVGGRVERMSEEMKALFDHLTEDAMRLLENGDYNVYEERQETFEREAEGYETLMRALSGKASGTSTLEGESSHSAFRPDNDMFSDTADESQQSTGPSSENGLHVLPAMPSIHDGEGQLNMFGGIYDDDGNLDIFKEEEGVKVENRLHDEAANLARLTGHEGAIPAEGSGYVLDESSGYFYNSEVGYYYDARSGLYCNAATGIWYTYDEETAAYSEMKVDYGFASYVEVTES